jgi:REP element-mobilizing transposase RayT
VKCTRADRPFHIDAWVVLPDHVHCVITLPPGDDDLHNRIKAMNSFCTGAAANEGAFIDTKGEG